MGVSSFVPSACSSSVFTPDPLSSSTRIWLTIPQDEIHFQHPKPPVTNILGGAGSFAALGARIATPAAMSRCISWIVDAGNDFPLELREEIATWGTSCSIRETPERKTTRGWNGYDENEHRSEPPLSRLDACADG